MCTETNSQAPSYARRLQSETTTHPPTYLLTGVKCRATSVAKNLKSSEIGDPLLCFKTCLGKQQQVTVPVAGYIVIKY